MYLKTFIKQIHVDLLGVARTDDLFEVARTDHLTNGLSFTGIHFPNCLDNNPKTTSFSGSFQNIAF